MMKNFIKICAALLIIANFFYAQQLSKKMGSHVNGERYKGSYKNGLKDGLFIEYIPNGTKVIEGNYKEDVKNGSWEYFFETGSKDMKGSFKNGLQDGEWNYWYPNGDLYYKGKLVVENAKAE